MGGCVGFIRKFSFFFRSFSHIPARTQTSFM
jgi:hypothetical protein